mgnify:FL=1
MPEKNELDLFSSALETGEVTREEVTRVLYLDTETTGADPETAHICELALLLTEYRGFSRIRENDTVLQQLVSPPVPVPPEASAVHHITNSMLEGSPPVGELAGDVSRLVDGSDYICAHNLPYDLSILLREMPEVWSGIGPDAQLDSLRLSRHLWPLIPSHSLQALRYRFELDSGIRGSAHRAMFDTELVRALLEYVTAGGLVPAGSWMELADYISSPLEIKVFSFGKYRGKLVEDIAARDRDYIMWLLKQEWVPKDYPDLYHTILDKVSDRERG